jgi:hypothetical protein
VHAGSADTWIQVMAAGHPSRCIVLHVSRDTTINDAVAALEEAWSYGSDDRFVIHLAPAA